jgi:hypothetical protein
MGKVIFHTAGNGLWSDTKKSVTIVNMRLGFVNDEQDFGELRVYFDIKTWNIDEDGLIYTDDGFIKELRKFLHAHGLPGNDVYYSEQGMQGYAYVSCDVGEKFLNSWKAKFGSLDSIY